MAATTTIIGRTARVRGRVTGDADLEVQGFVEGEISVSGDVTVDAHGLVGAGIRGRRLVVRGAVKGDLLGDEAILLEEGARVVGDVRAPRVAIAPGALVRGYVETGEAGGSARVARTAAAARPAPVAARTAAAPPPSKPAAIAAKATTVVAKAPAPGRNATNATVAAAAVAGAGGNNSGRHGANHAGGRRPPPPVVPALKKAKGQIAKKKER
jgi:cytoskeletal protein CcmA (bactofilin family)